MLVPLLCGFARALTGDDVSKAGMTAFVRESNTENAECSCSLCSTVLRSPNSGFVFSTRRVLDSRETRAEWHRDGAVLLFCHNGAVAHQKREKAAKFNVWADALFVW